MCLREVSLHARFKLESVYINQAMEHHARCIGGMAATTLTQPVDVDELIAAIPDEVGGAFVQNMYHAFCQLVNPNQYVATILQQLICFLNTT